MNHGYLVKASSPNPGMGFRVESIQNRILHHPKNPKRISIQCRILVSLKENRMLGYHSIWNLIWIVKPIIKISNLITVKIKEELQSIWKVI